MRVRWGCVLGVCVVRLLVASGAPAGEVRTEARFVVSGADPRGPDERREGTLIVRGSPLTLTGVLWKNGRWLSKGRRDFEGVSFEVFKLGPEGREPLNIRFEGAPESLTYGHRRGESRDYALWHVRDDLEPGRYVLRISIPSALEIGPLGGSELPFEIVEPRSDEDRHKIMAAHLWMHKDTGDFREAEEQAFRIGAEYGPEDLPLNSLADVYRAVGMYERAFEFQKEFIRRAFHAIATSTNLELEEFKALAIEAGAAKDAKEAENLLFELVRKVEAGEDTGKLPEAYLRPVIGRVSKGIVPDEESTDWPFIAVSALAFVLAVSLAVVLARRTGLGRNGP